MSSPDLPLPPRGERTPHHDYRVVVSEADIDVNRHANNIVYLRWVQDAAISHWRAAVDRATSDAIAWVVARHEIDYKKPAFAGDALVVRTWVEAMSAVTSERHCAILRESDGQLLAQVRTVWCAVNPATGRPRRLPAGLDGKFVQAASG
ncbi:MAG: acyl-CoA thioesterase [Opitutaceae bacterium]|nr:acyl-CoA thioesterase [Opitutaceae bacterium]